jgi:hypothetical protein
VRRGILLAGALVICCALIVWLIPKDPVLSRRFINLETNTTGHITVRLVNLEWNSRRLILCEEMERKVAGSWIKQKNMAGHSLLGRKIPFRARQ